MLKSCRSSNSHCKIFKFTLKHTSISKYTTPLTTGTTIATTMVFPLLSLNATSRLTITSLSVTRCPTGSQLGHSWTFFADYLLLFNGFECILSLKLDLYLLWWCLNFYWLFEKTIIALNIWVNPWTCDQFDSVLKILMIQTSKKEQLIFVLEALLKAVFLLHIPEREKLQFLSFYLHFFFQHSWTEAKM